MIELRFIRQWTPEQRTTTSGWLWRWSRRVYEDDRHPTTEPGRTEKVIFVHLRRLLALLVLGLIIGYAGVTTTGWWWFQRRIGESVAFVDVAWPPRWPHLKQARTEAIFSRGFRALEERRYSDAVLQLNAGLRRDPQRDDARLALASLYGDFHDYAQALALLDPPFAARRVSLPLFVLDTSLAFTAEDFARALAHARQVLRQPPPVAPELVLRARQVEVRALIGEDRGAEALAAAESLAGSNDSESFQCRIDALRQEKQFAAALALARRAQARFPTDADVLAVAGHVARDAHDIGALRAFLAAAIAAQPHESAVRQAAVLEWWQAGEPAAAMTALDSFLLRFDSDPDAVYRLSTAATALGALPIIETLRLRALSLGAPTVRLDANLIEACIVNGDLAGLRRLRPRLPALAVTTDPVLQLWPPLVEAVFQVVEGNPVSSALPLQTLLRRLRLPASSSVRFVQLLLGADRPVAAAELLDQALAAFPSAPSLNAIAPAVRAARTAALAARQPAPANVETPALDAPAFFAQGETLLAAGRVAELSRLIADHRRANPSWLRERSRDLDWLELRRALAADDKLTVRRLAQLYLGGDASRLDQMIDLAVQLENRGDHDRCVLLVDAILRNAPAARPRLIDAGLLPPEPAAAAAAK